jgi:hypothetical protein
LKRWSLSVSSWIYEIKKYWLLTASPVVCPGNATPDVGNRLIAHPTDCNKFFFCKSAIPRPLACEEHLAFDLASLTCIERSKVHRW